MIEIKDLLAKFGNMIVSEEVKKNAIRTVISEVSGIDIKTDEITVKNGTIFLDIKPIYKNEILLKKDKIFSELQNILGKKTPSDVR